MPKQKNPSMYLIIAEQASRSSKSMHHYHSIHNYNNKLWGFMLKPPVPSWYPMAKDVLLSAIKSYPEHNGFGLSYDGEFRTITVYSRSKEHRKILEEVVSDFIKQKRAEEKKQKGLSLLIGDPSEKTPRTKKEVRALIKNWRDIEPPKTLDAKVKRHIRSKTKLLSKYPLCQELS